MELQVQEMENKAREQSWEDLPSPALQLNLWKEQGEGGCGEGELGRGATPGTGSGRAVLRR